MGPVRARRDPRQGNRLFYIVSTRPVMDGSSPAGYLQQKKQRGRDLPRAPVRFVGMRPTSASHGIDGTLLGPYESLAGLSD